MIWILAISVLINGVSSALAWLAKIWWGKEYRASKEAQIEVLREQIKFLHDMTPMKIREYFLSVRKQLEEHIEALQAELKNAREEIELRDNQIKEIIVEGREYKVIKEPLSVITGQLTRKLQQVENKLKMRQIQMEIGITTEILEREELVKEFSLLEKKCEENKGKK